MDGINLWGDPGPYISQAASRLLKGKVEDEEIAKVVSAIRRYLEISKSASVLAPLTKV